MAEKASGAARIDSNQNLHPKVGHNCMQELCIHERSWCEIGDSKSFFVTNVKLIIQ